MNYSEQKDEILVSLTLLGNQDAYEALVIRHQRAVLAAARSVTRSEPLAEDAAQDAFVSAWLKLSALKDGSKFGAWVCNIAKNRGRDLLMQFHDWVDVDWLSAMEAKDGYTPEYLIDTSEENSTLHENVNALTEKIRTVINLHYFEGYSISEIARKLSLPEGTVKARLHEGRKKLRKEYGLMNEKDTDTLVQKVMKKVEELKLWRLNRNREGFDKIWLETKSAVEALPDCTEKDYAMADTLLLGYWWVDGEHTDETLKKIREYATASKNESAMVTVMAYECDKVDSPEKISYMKNTLIPEMESLGFKAAQGYLWFWLGYELLGQGDKDAAKSSFEKAAETLSPSNEYYACALSALNTLEIGYDETRESITVLSEEYRFIDGEWRYWCQPGYFKGNSCNKLPSIGYNAGCCFDRRFFTKERIVGKTHVSSDGLISLTLTNDNVTVDTPAGVFDQCEEWFVKDGNIEIYTYYKDGIGIIRQRGIEWGIPFDWVLREYHIEGGEGMFPLATGNYWDYEHNYSELGMKREHFKCISHREITYADSERAVLSDYSIIGRLSYDNTSWDGILEELKETYAVWDVSKNLDIYIDVREKAALLEKYADTPSRIQICKSIRELMDKLAAGEKSITPDAEYANYFNCFIAYELSDDNRALGDLNEKYMFNHHSMPFGDWTPGTWEEKHKLIYNNVYGILYDAANTLWDERWEACESYDMAPHVKYYRNITGKVEASKAGTIETPAGTFDNCICVHIEPKGFNGYWPGDRKEYYFAPGVGIVKTVHHYGNKGELEAVYELTRYVGECEGYLSFADGMERTFEAQNTRDGYVSKSEYKFVRDEEDRLLVLSDLTGIKKL